MIWSFLCFPFLCPLYSRGVSVSPTVRWKARMSCGCEAVLAVLFDPRTSCGLLILFTWSASFRTSTFPLGVSRISGVLSRCAPSASGVAIPSLLCTNGTPDYTSEPLLGKKTENRIPCVPTNARAVAVPAHEQCANLLPHHTLMNEGLSLNLSAVTGSSRNKIRNGSGTTQIPMRR